MPCHDIPIRSVGEASKYAHNAAGSIKRRDGLIFALLSFFHLGTLILSVGVIFRENKDQKMTPPYWIPR